MKGQEENNGNVSGKGSSRKAVQPVSNRTYTATERSDSIIIEGVTCAEDMADGCSVIKDVRSDVYLGQCSTVTYSTLERAKKKKAKAQSVAVDGGYEQVTPEMLDYTQVTKKSCGQVDTTMAYSKLLTRSSKEHAYSDYYNSNGASVETDKSALAQSQNSSNRGETMQTDGQTAAPNRRFNEIETPESQDAPYHLLLKDPIRTDRNASSETNLAEITKHCPENYYVVDIHSHANMGATGKDEYISQSEGNTKEDDKSVSKLISGELRGRSACDEVTQTDEGKLSDKEKQAPETDEDKTAFIVENDENKLSEHDEQTSLTNLDKSTVKEESDNVKLLDTDKQKSETEKDKSASNEKSEKDGDKSADKVAAGTDGSLDLL